MRKYSTRFLSSEYIKKEIHKIDFRKFGARGGIQKYV